MAPSSCARRERFPFGRRCSPTLSRPRTTHSRICEPVIYMERRSYNALSDRPGWKFIILHWTFHICFLVGIRCVHDSDVREVSVLVVVVEAVPHHPTVRNLEPYVIEPHRQVLVAALADQDAGPDGRRLPQLEVPYEIREGAPRADDVLHQDDVPSLDVDPQIHRQTNRAGREVAAVVFGKGNEVHRTRHGQPPGEVGEEHVRPAQDADHQQILDAGVIVRDTAGELVDPISDRRGGDDGRWLELAHTGTCWPSCATWLVHFSFAVIRSPRAFAACGSPCTRYVVRGGRVKPPSQRSVSFWSAWAERP